MKAGQERSKELVKAFVKFAESRDDIRAAMIVGSSARTDHPADEYSDVDIVIFARDPSRYLQSTDWITHFGKPMLTFLEKTAVGGGKERRVLFDNGQDVDFAVFPVEEASVLTEEDVSVLGRGVRVLLDRDGSLQKIVDSAESRYSVPKRIPTETQYSQALNDFLYHVVWTDKKLKRGETWTAKACCDSYLKWLLLGAIETHAVLTKGEDLDTWHNGRFLEQWAEPSVLEKLSTAYARYDGPDIRRALKQTLELYHSLTVDIARRLGFSYPDQQYEATRKIVGMV